MLINRGKRAGFSIVEISVVIGIILVMSGGMLLTNENSWLYRNRVDNAARILAVDLRRTQQSAIGKKINYYLQLLDSLGKNDTQYGYQIYEGAVVGSGTALTAAPNIFDKNVAIGEDLTSNNYIMFGPLGQVVSSNLRVGSAAPNPYYVQLESLEGSEVRYMCISLETGYVDITKSAP